MSCSVNTGLICIPKVPVDGVGRIALIEYWLCELMVDNSNVPLSGVISLVFLR